VQDDIAFFPLNGIIFALYPREKLAEDAATPSEKTGFPGLRTARESGRRKQIECPIYLFLPIKKGIQWFLQCAG
jgi:hypothetical protein